MRTASVFSAVVLLGGVAVSALPAAAPPVVPAAQLERRVNLNITDLIEKGKELIDGVKLPENIEVPDGNEVGDMWDTLLDLVKNGGK